MDLDVLRNEITSCRKCPRLVAWREEIARTKRKAYQDWDYWGKPVPGFGDPNARVLVVGLAPGAHGSNRTGRQFTGDASGDFLFPALHRAGFASQPGSASRDDGMRLFDLYLTASGRCAPPKNRPTAKELENCQPYLEREIQYLQPKVIVALGRVAFDRVLRIHSARDPAWKFAHNGAIRLGGRGPEWFPRDPWLVSSYHPSQQNTQTGKLTMEMFDAVWEKVSTLLETT